jgi:8-oxo-dGTP diphosphatase
MRTVYTVAFLNEKFLMVFNTKRNGWEMPGGKIECQEDIIKAAKREYAEEAGYDIDIISVRDLGYCWVCAAELGEKICDCEMESRLFERIPEKLSFEREEYEDVVPWALRELKQKRRR